MNLARILLVAASGVVAVVVCALTWWTFGSYKPDAVAVAAMSGATDEGGWYEFGGRESCTGVVLYPGARVDAEAYAPLASELSEQTGAMVAVVRVPLDMALLDGDAADEVIAAHPEVRRWTLAGHSLGGVAAAAYAEERAGETVDGLLLFASYPSGGTDLSNDQVEVASILGSRDRVLDRRSFEEAKSRLPELTGYMEIEGMNHAQFGSYGPQEGDGKPTVTDGRAVREVVDASKDLVQGGAGIR
ncbi:MAG TPA: alpha/beta hydrolase [Rubrobacter sp.]|nr:alpha/beta hydrolase [Rubrobacter sp.]